MKHFRLFAPEWRTKGESTRLQPLGHSRYLLMDRFEE
jgi:hypothetical protein